MILKFKVPEVKNKWMYFDHVDRISVSRDLKSKKEFDKQWKTDEPPFDCDAVFIDMDMDFPVSLVCFRKSRLSNEDEMAIWFNTEAYLLNDEGKTIERL